MTLSRASFINLVEHTKKKQKNCFVQKGILPSYDSIAILDPREHSIAFGANQPSLAERMNGALSGNPISSGKALFVWRSSKF